MTNPLPLAAPSPQDRAYLDELRRGFQADYAPRTTAEFVLLDELIAAAQRLFHLNRIEAHHLQGAPDLDTLGKISRQRLAAEHTFHRSRQLLEPNKANRLSPVQNEPDSPQPAQMRTNKPNPVSEPSVVQPNPTKPHTPPAPPPKPDPCLKLLDLYRSAHADSPDPTSAARLHKAEAHLRHYRSRRDPALLRRELVGILYPSSNR